MADDRDDDLEDKSVAMNNAYTGMLAISLAALILGCVLLFLDYSRYPKMDPPKIEMAPPMISPKAK